MAKSGINFTIPLGTKALYLNLTSHFLNGTVTMAEHTNSDLIRTAVIAQKFKSLSLTLSRNVSLSTVNFTVCGKVGNDEKKCVNFSLTGDTKRENKTLVLTEQSHWTFNYTDSQSREVRVGHCTLQQIVAC